MTTNSQIWLLRLTTRICGHFSWLDISTIENKEEQGPNDLRRHMREQALGKTRIHAKVGNE